MGTDYDCGCRESMNHWFLCRTHEEILLKILLSELYSEKRGVDSFIKQMKQTKK